MYTLRGIYTSCIRENEVLGILSHTCADHRVHILYIVYIVYVTSVYMEGCLQPPWCGLCVRLRSRHASSRQA
jgi:hypothetical protein